MNRYFGFAAASIIASMLQAPMTAAQDYAPGNKDASTVGSPQQRPESFRFAQAEMVTANEDDAAGPAYLTGFFAGAELAFLKPHFKDNVAYVFQDDNFVSTFQTFDYGYETSPRLWLGYQTSSGLGLRVAYFEFHQSAQRSDIVPPGEAPGFSPVIDPEFNSDFITFSNGDAVVANHSLELHSGDLEATQRAVVGAWNLLAGFGIRYATIDQYYRLTVTPSNALAFSDSRFDGVGPTVSLQAERPLWRGLAIFSSARGSMLFGEDSSRTFVFIPAFLFQATTVRDADEQLSIGELQLGLEWSTRTRFGDAGIRGTWGGQVWNGARSLTGTDEYMALMGFGITLGITR